jgi:hypothetical protein
VIRITAGYLKTVGEGPSGELTFYSSECDWGQWALDEKLGW